MSILESFPLSVVIDVLHSERAALERLLSNGSDPRLIADSEASVARVAAEIDRRLPTIGERALLAERVRLLEAALRESRNELAKRGHTEACRYGYGSPDRCDCGIVDVLAAIDAALEVEK